MNNYWQSTVFLCLFVCMLGATTILDGFASGLSGRIVQIVLIGAVVTMVFRVYALRRQAAE
jgi:hypothetical protein